MRHALLRHARRWIAALTTLGCAGGCTPEQVLLLHPAGPVARTERDIILLSIGLVSIVVVPVIVLLGYIVRRFRDRPGNDAPYQPDWSESPWLEVVWWGIPIVIIGILAVATVRQTFALTRPPAASGPPLTVQVTSLNWKWLFQYPEHGIATVNYCEIPVGRPVEFVLTSNAPMNSFWVPQLGGQEYTMAGMAMRLWLQADKPGTYYGHGANFSGQGFAHMHFRVIAVPQPAFARWAREVQAHAPALTWAGYQRLVQPGLARETAYSSYPPGIFAHLVEQEGGMYMKHPAYGTD
ncbi:quinol oxidase subunit 2 [Alicyclobacillus cellulosilyticus]|uniref:Quinol oxidase subunit 2 n=1 Tax=Alicyclobacillus cellulosilyticus TaxID=1003997 RepID=A0A917NFW3_9BACL|nr:cytochrome c oxidase subunit II [Alicyclobacillus cellulosilyticus]GGI97232.1 quinol oxidase subunit 2 [Alicyclobacillus cellulosilyticus]